MLQSDEWSDRDRDSDSDSISEASSVSEASTSTYVDSFTESSIETSSGYQGDDEMDSRQQRLAEEGRLGGNETSVPEVRITGVLWEEVEVHLCVFDSRRASWRR